jgi:hypothetical protein
LTKQCGFLKPNGDRCRGTVREGDTYCWAHDARYEEARRRGQSRGGKSKPGRELLDIKTRLSELAEDVMSGSADRSDAAVAGQLFNYVIRAIGMEMKVKEVEELSREVEELRDALEARRESKWG